MQTQLLLDLLIFQENLEMQVFKKKLQISTQKCVQTPMAQIKSRCELHLSPVPDL